MMFVVFCIYLCFILFDLPPITLDDKFTTLSYFIYHVIKHTVVAYLMIIYVLHKNVISPFSSDFFMEDIMKPVTFSKKLRQTYKRINNNI